MLLFTLGMLVGALLALRLAARRRARQQAQEASAVVRAHIRIRRLHAAALVDLAEAAQIAPWRPLPSSTPRRREPDGTRWPTQSGGDERGRRR